MERNLIVKANIILCVIMCAFSIYQAVTQKSIAYICCAYLWVNIGIIQFLYELMLKDKDKLIDAQRIDLDRKIIQNTELKLQIKKLKEE